MLLNVRPLTKNWCDISWGRGFESQPWILFVPIVSVWMKRKNCTWWESWTKVYRNWRSWSNCSRLIGQLERATPIGRRSSWASLTRCEPRCTWRCVTSSRLFWTTEKCAVCCPTKTTTSNDSRSSTSSTDKFSSIKLENTTPVDELDVFHPCSTLLVVIYPCFDI